MKVIKKSNKSSDYLRNLPLLNYTKDLHPGINLDDVYIICAQHLVSTTYSLFYSLINLGLKPSNISTIGKCYSTDPRAFEEMKKIGIDVCSTSLTFDSHVSFDLQYQNNIKKFVAQRISILKRNKHKKIIVLDDGGELIPEIDPVLFEADNIVGIEQTSSGYKKLRNKSLRFPIINLARSSAKLTHESPIIADLVLESIIRSISKIDYIPKKVLIIGNGSIGAHIRKVVDPKYEVVIYDQIIEKSGIDKEDFEKSLNKFDIIIGCTGASVLDLNLLNKLKKGTLLVSASSSDREFNAVKLRRLVPSTNDCHENLLVNGLWLINCGFPVNFSSEFREIDCEKLQLTRSLILSAILQAYSDVSESDKIFIPLDFKNQREIVNEYYNIFPKNKLIEKYLI